MRVRGAKQYKHLLEFFRYINNSQVAPDNKYGIITRGRMKKYLVIIASMILLLSISQLGCSKRGEIKDQLILYLDTSRSQKIIELQGQLETYTNELRGLDAGSTSGNIDEEQVARQQEALQSRIADVKQQIEQMEKLSSTWLSNSKDWQVKKTQKGVFLISGYGLGWAMSDVSSGKWYYYTMDDTFKPADASAQKLRSMLTPSSSASPQ